MRPFRIVTALLFMALAGTGTSALAQQTGGRITVDAEAQVQAALFEASLTLEAVKKENSLARTQDRARIEELQVQLRAARRAASASDVQRLTAEIATLQKQYVEALAARDSEYARHIGDLRASVIDLADLPDGAGILASRGHGNLEKSRAEFDALARARFASSGDKDQLVADLTAIAALAEDDRGFGETTTDEMLARFEELTYLAPKSQTHWLKLSALYRGSGQTSLARQAAENAVSSSASAGARAEAFDQIALMAVEQGDVDAAIEAARGSVEARRTIATASDPASLIPISQALSKIAELLLEQNELVSAEQTADEALRLAREIAGFFPGNLELRTAEADLLATQAYLFVAVGNAKDAAALQNAAVGIWREQLEDDPEDPARLRQTRDALNMLVQYLVIRDAPTRIQVDAEQASIEIARISERMAAVNPDTEGSVRDKLEAVKSLAALRFTNKNYEASRLDHIEVLNLSEQVLESNPSDQLAQTYRDMAVTSIAATYRMEARAAEGAADTLKILKEGLENLKAIEADHPAPATWKKAKSDLMLYLSSEMKSAGDIEGAKRVADERALILRSAGLAVN